MPTKTPTEVRNVLHHFIIPEELLAELGSFKQEEVLNLSEAAAFLRLDERDVLNLVHEQGLPGRQVGEEWRFLKAALRGWLGTAVAPGPSRKEAQLALVGKYKDDPDLMRICEEAYQKRGRPLTEED